MVEMELLGVKLELPSNTPVVMLREVEGRRRVLPIFIGLPEANAIAFALDGVVPPRPLTHDLLCNVLEETGWRLERVVVTELNEGTFYAELHLQGPAGAQVVSSRPSDAIALAVRVGAPMFADEAVVDEAAAEVDEPEEGDTDSEAVVEEFRSFIENVNPEDFAS
jgi:bifunctional DNase/RNase